MNHFLLAFRKPRNTQFTLPTFFFPQKSSLSHKQFEDLLCLTSFVWTYAKFHLHIFSFAFVLLIVILHLWCTKVLYALGDINIIKRVHLWLPVLNYLIFRMRFMNGICMRNLGADGLLVLYDISMISKYRIPRGCVVFFLILHHEWLDKLLPRWWSHSVHQSSGRKRYMLFFFIKVQRVPYVKYMIDWLIYPLLWLWWCVYNYYVALGSILWGCFSS